ncbi:DDE-1 multi-domain protein [Pyrenophora tritici-repentis]|nr:DDE-1 multi-domain protein [Pyrenophora tritici-repentis]KAI1594911.1 DDE-1 multi-domain protein [Pyrenophora tritici-repentis]
MDKASRVLAQPVPPSLSESYRARADRSGVPHTTLHHRARGRRSIEEKAQSQQYLAPYEEDALVHFLLQLSDLGQPVRIKYIRFLAFCVTCQRSETDRPLKPPGKNWTQGFEKRHPETQARRVKALDWSRHEKNTYWKITHWFETIGRVLKDPAIFKENVYNMDETGVMLSMLGTVKVLVGKDDMRDYRGARVKRTMVTAIECISGDGRYLDPMIIWPAATHRSNWTTFPTPGWQYACSDTGYTDSYISLQWLQRIFDPETRERARGKPRVLICDGFGTHETLEVLEFCFANNIILCRLPSHTSHKLQPCDVAVFAPLKAAYREQAERLERGGVNTIGKEHFTSLYSPAREKAFTPKNIIAGFAASGLFPFNPDRVLRSMPKPLADLSIPKADEVNVGACHRNEVPLTPVTPVSAEGLVSLRNMIIEQDAGALDKTSKRNLQRHLHKLAKAAELSLAKGALQQNHIRFLLTVNNEAKVRRSTKSLVLGKAKVMGYEELMEAREKRAEKDAAQEAKGKGKRGRKRTSAVLEADAAESKTKTMRTTEELAAAPVVATASTVAAVVGFETVHAPWRAPVARMY